MLPNSQHSITESADLSGWNESLGSRVVSQPIVRRVLKVSHASQASLEKESDAILEILKVLPMVLDQPYWWI